MGGFLSGGFCPVPVMKMVKHTKNMRNSFKDALQIFVYSESNSRTIAYEF